MSTDEKDWKSEIADEAKGLAVEVYKDGAKPAVKQVGETLGKVFGVLLAPLNVLAERGKALIDRLRPRIEAIPDGRLQLPAGPIAGPAMFHYAMLGDGDDTAELREMFENLLLAAMDSETARSAHPAFVGMLSQMTQEEAWILKSIDRDDYAMCSVQVTEPDGRVTGSMHTLLGLHTLLGADLVPDDTRRVQCISNLDRLGILHVGTSDHSADREGSKALERYLDGKFPEATRHAFVNLSGAIVVTPLGRRFIDTCVRTK